MLRKDLALILALMVTLTTARADEFKPLFPVDGVPKDWVVRAWADVSKPGPEGAQWKIGRASCRERV